MSETSGNDADSIGFMWWRIWAVLGLTAGNLFIFGAVPNNPGVAFSIVGLNSLLMVLILMYNKYAFLVATVISFNPLLWIINGVYLKKRWKHPKVNAKAWSSAAQGIAGPGG